LPANLQNIPAKSFRRDILDVSQPTHLFSWTYEAEKLPGYPLPKSFGRDILRGYPENSVFVFIDLARKHVF
jgi:hypothetical protein